MAKTVYGAKGGQIESYDLAGSHRCDERGWMLFPWEKRETEIDPKTIHMVHIRPEATRGNHNHPRVAEWICPIEGEGLLRWRSPSGEVLELHLEALKKCIRIRPGVAHAITNIGAGELLLLAAREKDPSGDLTVPEKVI
jgi:oxalate decarboxylase/phosphoglucose isomerase-like protein (cupin superfamily)